MWNVHFVVSCAALEALWDIGATIWSEREINEVFLFNFKQWLINFLFSFFFEPSFIFQTAKWLPFDTKCIIVNIKICASGLYYFIFLRFSCACWLLNNKTRRQIEQNVEHSYDKRYLRIQIGPDMLYESNTPKDKRMQSDISMDTLSAQRIRFDVELATSRDNTFVLLFPITWVKWEWKGKFQKRARVNVIEWQLEDECSKPLNKYFWAGFVLPSSLTMMKIIKNKNEKCGI